MDAIEMETVTVVCRTYRISVYLDEDAPSPLDDWKETGRILSLNRRHANFDPAGIEATTLGNPDAVPLSYFEHGQCLWSVAGELPPACRCPWDSVAFAGLWLPDSETLASAGRYGRVPRRNFLRERARRACDAYTAWCNGDIYGYQIHRIVHCGGGSNERQELVDACWGFYGRAACLDEARAIVERGCDRSC